MFSARRFSAAVSGQLAVRRRSDGRPKIRNIVSSAVSSALDDKNRGTGCRGGSSGASRTMRSPAWPEKGDCSHNNPYSLISRRDAGVSNSNRFRIAAPELDASGESFARSGPNDRRARRRLPQPEPRPAIHIDFAINYRVFVARSCCRPVLSRPEDRIRPAVSRHNNRIELHLRLSKAQNVQTVRG